MVLNNKSSELSLLKESNGYLICIRCNGYYKLKENESLDDFEACECGGNLILRSNLNALIDSEITGINDDEHYPQSNEELHEIIAVLKDKANERKKILEDLSNRILIQEELLNEIKEQRWHLWEILEKKNVEKDINEQKSLLENIMEQEDRLLLHIRHQRGRSKNIEKRPNVQSFIKAGPIIILILIIGIGIIYLMS